MSGYGKQAYDFEESLGDPTVQLKHRDRLAVEQDPPGRAMQGVFRKKQPLHPCWIRDQSGAWEGVPSLVLDAG